MKKILIVDNDPVLLKFMTRKLNTIEHEVVTAKDGISAMKILESFQPDIIFTDIIMPNISGDKLCQLIRTIPALKDCYLVIMSGAVAELEFDYHEVGANACMAKTSFGDMAKYMLELINQLDNLVQEEDSAIVFQDKVYERSMTRELLSKNRHLTDILQNIHDGIIELADERIVYVNHEFAEMVAKAEHDILSTTVPVYFDEQDQDRVIKFIESDAIAIGDIQQEERLKLNQRFVILKKIKTDIEYANTILLVSDISDQILKEDAYNELRAKKKQLQEAQTELKKNLNFKEQIVENSPTGIAIYNNSGQCTTVNTTMARMLGATKDQFLAQNYHHITSWKKTGLYQTAKNAASEKKVKNQEVTFNTPNGSCLLDCTFTPFVSNDEDHLLLIIDDISDHIQKAIEMAKQEL